MRSWRMLATLVALSCALVANGWSQTKNRDPLTDKEVDDMRGKRRLSQQATGIDGRLRPRPPDEDRGVARRDENSTKPARNRYTICWKTSSRWSMKWMTTSTCMACTRPTCARA